MKKILLTALMVFIVSFAYASTKEQIMSDLEVYSKEIDQKAMEHLMKIEQETAVIDNICEKRAKGDVDTSMKIIENHANAVIKFLESNTSKLKTPEVKNYHLLTIEYIKLRTEFLTAAVESYHKYNKQITDEERKRLTDKYQNKILQMDTKNAELLKDLQSKVHN